MMSLTYIATVFLITTVLVKEMRVIRIMKVMKIMKVMRITGQMTGLRPSVQ